VEAKEGRQAIYTIQYLILIWQTLLLETTVSRLSHDAIKIKYYVQ